MGKTVMPHQTAPQSGQYEFISPRRDLARNAL